uniref:PIN domain nuclease n=1 Tax=Klebsiella pneumoniae TaxID=573 RepID=UPI0029E80A49
MNYLFVDGNSLGYYHQQSDKLHNGEMEVQAVFGFVKNVRRYASILHARPMILWDGFSDKRRDYYPDYKANRDEDPEMKKMKEGFAVQKPYILKMMAALGVNQLIAKDAEADDLAGMLVGRLAPQPTVDHIYLLTGDGVFGDQLVDAKGCHHFQDVRLLDCKAFFHPLHFRIFIAICFVIRVIVATLVATAVPQDHGACVKNGRIATNVFDEAKH